MKFEYIFFGVAILFFAYMLLGDEIHYYKLFKDKKNYWKDYFPYFLSRTKNGLLKFLIGIVLVLAWIFWYEITEVIATIFE